MLRSKVQPHEHSRKQEKGTRCHSPLGLTYVCIDTLVVELSSGNVSLSPVVGLKVFGVEGSALYVG